MYASRIHGSDVDARDEIYVEGRRTGINMR